MSANRSFVSALVSRTSMDSALASSHISTGDVDWAGTRVRVTGVDVHEALAQKPREERRSHAG